MAGRAETQESESEEGDGGAGGGVGKRRQGVQEEEEDGRGGKQEEGGVEEVGPLRTYPMVILIAAYAGRRLPRVVRGVAAGLQQVPESLEEAARNLGASRMVAAARITLPLIMANIIAAGVLTFAFAVLEVSDSLILAQMSEHYPITKQLYILASTGTEDSANVASALGVYGMAFLGGTLAIAAALLGKRLGAIFRA